MFCGIHVLLGTRLGWHAQDALWRIVDAGDLLIHNITDAERTRMRVLMKQHRNMPMDLADASLVAVAESLDKRRIFTLDSDFHVYRAHNKEPFDILP